MFTKRFAALAAMGVMTALLVSGCYRSPEQRAEHIVKHLASELKLNDVQKAKLETIKNEFLARRIETIKMRADTVKEANALMRSAEIDKTKLNAVVESQQARANDTIRFVADKFTEIHDMLTPEQRDKLVTMIEKHMEKWKAE